MKRIFILLFIKFLLIISSDCYYLIDLDRNISLNDNYCSNMLINKDLYRIPNQCHKHLLCNGYHCDDQSFRCVKIRETLCCLYKYIEENCEKDLLKDQFRSIYFHISIQHGYCEINLERIEQNDHSYCLANHIETTTSFKHIHRYRHHANARLSKSSKITKSLFFYINFIILLLLRLS